MLMSRRVARALDYDFRLVPPAVMAPLQRRLEGGLGRTLSVLLGSALSDLAWERAKLPTFCGAGNVLVGCRLAQGRHVEHLRRRTRSTRCAASTGEPKARPHRAVQCTLRRLIEQAGSYADMERHVP